MWAYTLHFIKDRINWQQQLPYLTIAKKNLEQALKQPQTPLFSPCNEAKILPNWRTLSSMEHPRATG